MILADPAGPDPVMTVFSREGQQGVKWEAGHVTTEAMGSTIRKRRFWL